MKQISLTQGFFALVDDADFNWLDQFKWHVHRTGRTIYARRRISEESLLYMHRLILGLNSDDKRNADHINNNGLDNRRVNLRLCTKQENGFNQRVKIGGSSNFKGVCWDSSVGKWKSYISNNRKLKHLGRFDNEVQAALTYDRAAQRLFGKFARLNFPDRAAVCI